MQVRTDPAATVSVHQQERDCGKVGIRFEKHHLPEETSQSERIELVHSLNEDATIHGILVQMPLPKQIQPEPVVAAISPLKDVDGLHAQNLGLLVQGIEKMVPGTPKGIIELLNAYDIPIEGKRAVVLGRSILVGKPVALLLLNRHATVTLCHSRTQDLPEVTRQADILVVAVGKVGLVTADMVKPGAVVVDVAINRLEDRLVGDVDFENVKEIASAITPVPGGHCSPTYAAKSRA